MSDRLKEIAPAMDQADKIPETAYQILIGRHALWIYRHRIFIRISQRTLLNLLDCLITMRIRFELNLVVHCPLVFVLSIRIQAVQLKTRYLAWVMEPAEMVLSRDIVMTLR